ncbi:MAG: SIS domain-containing protein [Planctomycetota bacterium]
MCGIIAVLRRAGQQAPPTSASIEQSLDQALEIDLSFAPEPLARSLAATAESLADADKKLRGPMGIALLSQSPDLRDRIHREMRALEARLDNLENELDRRAANWTANELEAVNQGLVALRDGAWALSRDRLRTTERIEDLTGDLDVASLGTRMQTIGNYAAVQIALSALDRLEVRGRDSAGLQLLVRNHGLDTTDPEFLRRSKDSLYRNAAVRVTSDGKLVSFVYKRAAEIGELGDNTAALRDTMRQDTLLQKALSSEGAEVTVLGHTRWASVGIISEANAHPLDSTETHLGESPFVVAALNGDVDNHEALVAANGLKFEEGITTDAKVIPTLVSRRLTEGLEPLEAFRRTVATFEGSTAIGVVTEHTPEDIYLALRGSGQALYVGLANDAYVVASEPYGVVEECSSYLRMDGETPGNPADPVGSRGQVVRIRRDGAGTVEGIERQAFDGTELPVTEGELKPSAITTRDVDRGDAPHFLLKEISEAPRSFRKTLRGRISEEQGRLKVALGLDALPQSIRDRLRDGTITRILTIGQGTAAVAAQGVAQAMEVALKGSPIAVNSMPATELSGFRMRPDMSDTLIIAISQSGTTTDTNRTVDLVRGRGALVVAIVNRRGSDLTDKADGVLYTSDGRDVEMSVASTKAFYAQIAAGFLLAFAVADELSVIDASRQHDLLSALRSLPDAMTATLEHRPAIREAAALCTHRRYWALVGNGSNLIAAREIRIKLSELCYKSIACDATEDKKHIDLSSEPMILICAAGLSGSTADDVQKEVAIYRAHKALPIVIADEGEARFQQANAVIGVPPVHPDLAFVLSTVAGHLFGYECALAIDASARPLREARALIERRARDARDADGLFNVLREELTISAKTFQKHLAANDYDGTLEASTATSLGSFFRYAIGMVPLEAFELEFGEVGTPAAVIDGLTESLTKAIEELTRPVDAIKHQAKTVTVGISRSDEGLVTSPLVKAVLEAGAGRESISYAELRSLAGIAPGILSIDGFSRYEIRGEGEQQTVHQIRSGGVAQGLRSRTQSDARLKGTKSQVARERQILVALGRNDNRQLVFVPEIRGARTIGLTLLHVTLRDKIDPLQAKSMLTAYRDRFTKLCDAVTETEPSFNEAQLGRIDVETLLTESIQDLADHWRSTTPQDGR